MSGEVEISTSGTLDSIVANQEGAQVAEFKIEVSEQEGVYLRHLALENTGSADLYNPVLDISGDEFDGSVVGDYLVWDLDYFIRDDRTKTAKVFADVDGEGGDNARLQLDSHYDAVFVGSVYGFGVPVSPNSETFQNTVLDDYGTLEVGPDNDVDEAAVLWEANDQLALRFWLESEDEPFTVNELTFETDGLLVDRITLLDGNDELGSEATDEEDEVVMDADFTVGATKTYFDVVVDVAEMDEDAYDSFSVTLTGIEATGENSNEDVSLTPSIEGPDIHVYSALVGVERTDDLGSTATLIPGVEMEVLTFEIEAIGGDIRLASDSPFLTINVTDSGLKGAYTTYPWRLENDGDDVASGTITYSGNSFDLQLDDDMDIAEGNSEEFTLYVDFLNWRTIGTQYWRGEIKDNDGVLNWNYQDSDDDWHALSNVEDTMDLPVKSAQFSD
jgi:hypothetical protein